MNKDNILEVRDLKVWFPVRKGIFGFVVGHIKAVDGVSFDLRRGETLGVVGESGCGKSTTSRAILLLNKPCGGSITVDGVDITRVSGKDMMAYRRKVQVVFQDPHASLNPRHTVMEILTEGMVCHGLCKKDERRVKAAELLEAVGMPTDILRDIRTNSPAGSARGFASRGPSHSSRSCSYATRRCRLWTLRSARRFSTFCRNSSASSI